MNHAQAEKCQSGLEALLAKHMLRRTKDGTIKDQLPAKTDNIVFCRLAPMQYRAYQCAHKPTLLFELKRELTILATR